jgi:hypothetical protein
MGKLSFLVGVGVGYVLGARAGRQRYEQIKVRASRVWSSEPVQTRVGEATERVKSQAAPFVMDKVGDAVKSVGKAVKDRREGEHLPESLHRGTDGHLHADTTGYGPGPGKLP